jgi:cytoskeletal protein RodZ
MRKHLAATAVSIVATLLLGIGIAVAIESGPKEGPTTGSEAVQSSSVADESTETDEQETTESADSESEDVAKSKDANDETDSQDETDSTDTTESDAAGEHPENHGKYVSQAAHECPKGPEHGACVSAVAHSEQGKKQK